MELQDYKIGQGAIEMLRAIEHHISGMKSNGGRIHQWDPLESGLHIHQARPATAEEIHRDLDGQSDMELARAEKILEYKKLYPSNAFITKDRILQICRNYNLVLAPDFMFAGDIPQKNRRELGSFELIPRFNETIKVEINLGFTPEITLVQSLSPSKDFIAAIRPNINYVVHGGLPAARVWDAMQPYITPGHLYVQQNDLWFRIAAHEAILAFSVNITRDYSEFSPLSLIQEVKLYPKAPTMRADIQRSQASKMVVCPADMLTKDMPISIQRNEARIDPLGWGVKGGGYDPIILQPVEHGFLVVTKWGDEANIQDFQSSQEN